MDCEVYAVESYDSNDGTYRRHMTGTREEAVEYVSEHVGCHYGDSLYYRIALVSASDLADWNKQVKNLPKVPATEYLFGEYVQANVAAKYLGVTFGRVFQLASSGAISTKVEGRNKLVSVHDVVERRLNKPSAGRPPASVTESSE